MVDNWDEITIFGCEGAVIQAVTQMMAKQAKYYSFSSPFMLTLYLEEIEHLTILCCDQSPEAADIRDRLKIRHGAYVCKEDSHVILICPSLGKIQWIVDVFAPTLRKLEIHHTMLERLDISSLDNLEELDLSRNHRLSGLSELDQLPNLQDVFLNQTAIGPILQLGDLPSLWWLDISDTRVSQLVPMEQYDKFRHLEANGCDLSDVEFLDAFPIMDHLSLIGCRISQIPSLESFRELKWIYLDGNPIDSLENTRFPPSALILSLENLPIRRIPDHIRGLNQLMSLHLSGLNLEELPDWLPDLNLDFYRSGYGSGITLSRTTVKHIDMSVFDQSQDVILRWFRERKNTTDKGAPLNEVKVVFLGDGEAGKSHCIARLLKGGETLTPEEIPADSTPGIVIKDQSYPIGDRDVQVHFWDFGGQEILHSMHRMFLTERTLYVILINARDDTQDDRARYWLHNVKSFAGTAPVLLVLNKMDQNPNASVNETDLRAIYPGLTEVVKLSAMYDDPETFNTRFTEAMKRQIGKMDNLGFFFPASWTEAKRRLLDMTENYIKGSDYTAICDESGVTDEGDLRRSLLNWFNDLGVSICYGGNARLRDYVILRPNWITNAVYAILFNKHPDTRNGIISHEAIFEMIQPSGDGPDPYRRTNSAERYTQAEIDYILGVTRKFRLSFQVDGEREFIPMLCQRESLPIAAEYAANLDALEFRMTFDYLPSNVLHRLMVELRQDLDTSRVWRTGAHFEQKSSGLSALVKTGGNVLQIYVRGTKAAHRPNTYLCILKDAIDNIVRDMNLAAPVNEVVYKLEGKAQAFDYDELVDSLEYGETTRYSRVHRRRLKIEDILNQTGRQAETERRKLLQDVYQACQQMQSQKIYWNLPKDELRSKEDIRNDCIRNALRGQQYFVSDQSRSGISPGGSQAGRLDMDIRLEPNVPWTIYEALNIRKATKSDMDRWDAHLDKLLGPYNPNGLPFLFLVSYVDCPKDDFTGICSGYFEHLRFHSAGAYELRDAVQLSLGTERYDPNHYIQAAKSIYDRGGFPTTVYHIFVHLGD